MCYIKIMNHNKQPQAAQVAQAFVAQNPNCCLLELTAHLDTFGFDGYGVNAASDLRGDCEPIGCGDGNCPYASNDE